MTISMGFHLRSTWTHERTQVRAIYIIYFVFCTSLSGCSADIRLMLDPKDKENAPSCVHLAGQVLQ